MALTPSSMEELGTGAPDFSLPDTVSGQVLGRDGVRGERGLLVMFLCNHCPYVVHLQQGLAALGRDYADSGVGLVAISANDVQTHPDDHPDRMAELAARLDWRFPYLYDESQEVARAYGAACTPDFFLFDAGLRLAYRGRFDESRPGSGAEVTGRDLRAALDAVAQGQTPGGEQLPSMGCNIKWKAA